MNKVIRFIKWLFRYKVSVSRVEVLKLAREYYLQRISKRHFTEWMGLCFAIYHAAERYGLTDVATTNIFELYFPEFQPPQNKCYDDYWWDLSDVKSRLVYLDELIYLYDGDKTNLYDIMDRCNKKAEELRVKTK